MILLECSTLVCNFNYKKLYLYSTCTKYVHNIYVCSSQHDIYDYILPFSDSCECQAVYTGDICFLPNFVIEDVQSCFKTLKQLCEAVYELNNKHRNYLRILVRETKYGSK